MSGIIGKKVGMSYNTKISVKCINRENLIEPRGGKLLTVGKFYDLLEVEENEGRNYDRSCGSIYHSTTTIYWIIDDTGTRRFFDGTRFDPNPIALKRLLRLGELDI